MDDKKLLGLVLAMYANEPCRICGELISAQDVAEVVWVGYNEAGTSRAAHKRCFETVVDRVERQRRWIEDLQSGQYVNCVYCGHRYGPEDSTPVSRAELLKQHVMKCPEHPMAQMKKEVERLRAERDDLLAACEAISEALVKGELIWKHKRQSDGDPYHPANVALCAAIAKAAGA